VLPEIVAGPLFTATVTGKPELATGDAMLNAASPNVLFPIVANAPML